MERHVSALPQASAGKQVTSMLGIQSSLLPAPASLESEFDSLAEPADWLPQWEELPGASAGGVAFARGCGLCEGAGPVRAPQQCEIFLSLPASCSKELNQWEPLTEYGQSKGHTNPYLVLECAWRVSNWAAMKEALVQVGLNSRDTPSVTKPSGPHTPSLPHRHGVHWPHTTQTAQQTKRKHTQCRVMTAARSALRLEPMLRRDMKSHRHFNVTQT
ncbi:hypothetical protein JZ751_006508 [Albula glossodonta]|uniref:Uncharacterized protein n=1 Tax=Albula glossodonta TaxID=121402 RepID=A0A8T2N5S0_9TELE|nr:hypothetical protein JZ751_006508 [Albula glossodonta]